MEPSTPPRKKPEPVPEYEPAWSGSHWRAHEPPPCPSPVHVPLTTEQVYAALARLGEATVTDIALELAVDVSAHERVRSMLCTMRAAGRVDKQPGQGSRRRWRVVTSSTSSAWGGDEWLAILVALQGLPGATCSELQRHVRQTERSVRKAVYSLFQRGNIRREVAAGGMYRGRIQYRYWITDKGAARVRTHQDG